MVNEQNEVEALVRQLTMLRRLTIVVGALSIITLLVTTLRLEAMKNLVRTESLVAKRVTIVDTNMTPRIILGGVDNSYSIIFQDSAGTTRLGMGVLEQQGQFMVTVSLRDPMGRRRVWLGVLPEGTPVIAAQDETGKLIFKAP